MQPASERAGLACAECPVETRKKTGIFIILSVNGSEIFFCRPTDRSEHRRDNECRRRRSRLPTGVVPPNKCPLIRWINLRIICTRTVSVAVRRTANCHEICIIKSLPIYFHIGFVVWFGLIGAEFRNITEMIPRAQRYAGVLRIVLDAAEILVRNGLLLTGYPPVGDTFAKNIAWSLWCWEALISRLKCVPDPVGWLSRILRVMRITLKRTC